MGALEWLVTNGAEPPFDIVFLDPPYRSGLLEPALRGLVDGGLLGPGARVVAEAFDHLDAPPIAITGADVPMPYAANLERLALPSVEGVVEAAKSVCYRE